MRHPFGPCAFPLGACLLSAAVGGAAPRDLLLVPNFISGCSFLTSVMLGRGKVAVVGPIHCPFPVIIHVDGEFYIMSYDTVDTINVHFVVHETGMLQFVVKGAVHLERDMESTIPLLDIDGEVEVLAAGRMVRPADGYEKNNGSAVIVNEGGSLASNGPILYTQNSVVIADVFHTFKWPQGYKARTRTHSFTLPKVTLEDAGIQDQLWSTSPSPFVVSLINSLPLKHHPSDQPRRSELHVDTVLRGKLATEDYLSLVWARYDGAIVFGKRAIAPTEDNKWSPIEQQVLIAPDGKKVAEAYRAWALFRLMEGEDVLGPAGGDRDKRLAKSTKREKELAKIVKEHLREVDLMVTKRGCLTVSIDGINVLERCGPSESEWRNRFPWARLESDKYVLRATEDGLEVVLDEKRVWALSLAGRA